MKKMLNYILSTAAMSGYDINAIKASVVNSDEIPYKIDIVAENLSVPWAIDISDNNKLYFTERSGAVRLIDQGVLQAEPLITFGAPFIQSGEGGLLGIALDPDFTQKHSMYVMHSYTSGRRIYNRVVRLIEKDNKALVSEVILDKIPGGSFHNGGRLKIGPDNKLYITTGDSGNSNLAQNLSSTAGKILRIELDGGIPKDNPFPNSPVYSYGHRDPQGLAWNSNGILYESEHGAVAHDEINIIKPGDNYGWPLVEGDEDLPNRRLHPPLIHSKENTWAPSGIAYISQGPWQGKLLVAALRGKQLLVITLNQDGTGVEKVESMLWNEYGRLREVIQAKDGTIYLTTSNRDGRGDPDRTDDKIIRLIPK